MAVFLLHVIAVLALIQSRPATSFSPSLPSRLVKPLASSASSSDAAVQQQQEPAPPNIVLNGKRVLPYKIITGALKGGGTGKTSKVPAVYAVLNSSYQRGTEGWEAVTFTGVAHDLAATLQSLKENDATELRVAHVRALSFSFPEPNAMQEVARQWRAQAKEAGAADLDETWASAYLFDEDDDDDDDEFDEDDLDAMIVSPFDPSASKQDTKTEESSSDDESETLQLEFTRENVDALLDQVRPYLIADGGNVAVERVGGTADDDDEKTNKEVVLKLEGACGSCASSTVTMQMGIERVLKEMWPDVVITQVEDDAASKPTQLSQQAVEEEVNRLRPALIAMGSVVELLDVDAETGVVQLKFQGGSKVRAGLELAIADLPFVTSVKFVESDDE